MTRSKSKYVALSKGNTEDKVFPRHAMKGCRWIGSIAPRVLNLSWPHAHATLPRRSCLQDPSNRRVGGLRSRYGRCEKRIISKTFRGFEPRIVDHVAVAKSVF
jgi:hypothetical protein